MESVARFGEFTGQIISVANWRGISALNFGPVMSELGNDESAFSVLQHTYLAQALTMILKVVRHFRGLAIALRLD